MDERSDIRKLLVNVVLFGEVINRNGFLARLGVPELERSIIDHDLLSEGFRLGIVKDPTNGNMYLLDVNLYPGLQGIQSIYLGYVFQEREVNIDGERHTFVQCNSNQQGFFGVHYSKAIQEKDLCPFTRDTITWLDGRLHMIKEPKGILSGLDEEILGQMKTDGIINYAKIQNTYEVNDNEA